MATLLDVCISRHTQDYNKSSYCNISHPCDCDMGMQAGGDAGVYLADLGRYHTTHGG